MATYTELSVIENSRVLIDKLAAAVAVQAEVVRAENAATTNHANRLVWAKAAFQDPRVMAQHMVWAILAQNAAATDAQIRGATDATLLSAVALAVDVFATGA